MILIAGLGYIGEALADHLHALGKGVMGLTKSPDSAAALDKAKPYPVHACDISDREALLNLQSAICTAPTAKRFGNRRSGAKGLRRARRRRDNLQSLVHCASSGRGGEDSYREVYLEGARNLLETFPNTPLLFTSSTGVYAQDDGSTVTEESPAKPDRDTGRILLEAENLVLSSGGTVARLAGIYGPGRSIYLKRFLSGTAIIEGGGDRFLNQAHRADIVSAIALLLGLSDASGGIYNVVDDTPQTQRECYAFLAEHFKRDLPPAAASDLDRKRGWTNKRVSNARLRGLGWSPAYPSFQDAVRHDPALVPSIEAQI